MSVAGLAADAQAQNPSAGATAPGAGQSGAETLVQVPKMKFGNVEISRLLLGCNPLHGYSHFNTSYGNAMRDWYTPERVCAVMHRANAFGINAMNYTEMGRGAEDLARFRAEGGIMHLVAYDATDGDPAALVRKIQPLSMHRQGEVVDVAFRNGTMNTVREWCKRVRDTGVPTGVATHKPEVIDFVESQGWDVDYFAGCAYNRTRSEEEWRKILNGNMLEAPHEIYLQGDPERMYKTMRQTPKPCFAFKILAAGRVREGDVAQAFRTAFSSIKPIDGVFVGMFPKDRDEVKLNAEITHSVLTGA
jgi:hypothetical protein